jgi:hypothetical protein
MRTLLVLLLLCLQSPAAGSASIHVLGQAIQFDLPGGYCLSENSTEAEKLLSERSQEALRGTAKLVAWLAPCEELRSFQRGRRFVFDHWIQLQVLTPRGQLRNVGVSREQLVASLAGSNNRLDSKAMRSRAQSKFSEMGISMQEARVDLIGRDGNAAYLATAMRISVDGEVRHIRGYGAITLINTVPLAVQGYEAARTDESLDRTRDAVAALLRSMLVKN